jgi:hypothetical protein
MASTWILRTYFKRGLDWTRKWVTCFEAYETSCSCSKAPNWQAYTVPLSLSVIVIITQNMNYSNLNFGGDFLVHWLKWYHCHDSLLGECSSSISVTGVVVFSHNYAIGILSWKWDVISKNDGDSKIAEGFSCIFSFILFCMNHNNVTNLIHFHYHKHFIVS